MRNRLCLAAALGLLGICYVSQISAAESFVRVSPRDSRYFELSDGKPYIPIGLNMIAPPGRDEKQALATMEDWMWKLSANGGNYIRLWLSNPFFDVEHAKSGVYDEDKAKRIDAVLALARKYNIRVKMTLEHFRHLGDGKQTWAGKPIYHVSQGGPAKDIADFFANPASREQFKKKLDWYAKRYGDDPDDLCLGALERVRCGPGHVEARGVAAGRLGSGLDAEMLDALHQRFPKNLAVQSLGSFDTASQDGDLPHLLPDAEQRPRPGAPLPGPGGKAGGLPRTDGRSDCRRRTDPALFQLRKARPAGRERGGRAESQRSLQALRQGQGGHPPARCSLRAVLRGRGGFGTVLALGLLRGEERSLVAVRPIRPSRERPRPACRAVSPHPHRAPSLANLRAGRAADAPGLVPRQREHLESRAGRRDRRRNS